ncbi:MAG: hypothetical protein EBY21_07745, partial [Alphaproteobacteria bacterium]|nr:hypothetical protein [Alphaproteobacteria bacterium]
PRQSLDGPIDEPQLETAGMNEAASTAPRPADARGPEPRTGDPKSRITAYAQSPNTENVTQIFDASEGTSLDPLKNKSWDLNSGKVVPSVMQPPGR